MNPLNAYLALEIINDHQQRAERHRRARPAAATTAPGYDAVTIRRATGADGPALERLAQLEGRPAPAGPALVAEAGRRVLAVRSLHDGVTLSHPFHPTAELVSLLEMRARHLGSRPRFATHPVRRVAALLRRRRSASYS